MKRTRYMNVRTAIGSKDCCASVIRNSPIRPAPFFLALTLRLTWIIHMQASSALLVFANFCSRLRFTSRLSLILINMPALSNWRCSRLGPMTCPSVSALALRASSVSHCACCSNSWAAISASRRRFVSISARLRYTRLASISRILRTRSCAESSRPCCAVERCCRRTSAPRGLCISHTPVALIATWSSVPYFAASAAFRCSTICATCFSKSNLYASSSRTSSMRCWISFRIRFCEAMCALSCSFCISWRACWTCLGLFVGFTSSGCTGCTASPCCPPSHKPLPPISGAANRVLI
mmetsp:Transcript_1168/g.2810  ORF Transcript_1168/g.2810 Transcript_1168/m.2810 type:complete len:294 (-) Transcript_1168:366-1247(-)